MPKDRYSDNYTIEVLQDNIFGVSSENINISEEDFSAVAANSVSIGAGTENMTLGSTSGGVYVAGGIGVSVNAGTGSFVVDSTGGVDITTIGEGATIDINSGGILNFVAATGIVLTSPSHDISADSPNFTIDESGVTCDALITAGLQLTTDASADSILVSSSDGTASWSSLSTAINAAGVLQFSGLDIYNSVAAEEGWSVSDTNRSSAYNITARFNDVFGIGSDSTGSSDYDVLYPPGIILCPWGDKDDTRAATAGVVIGSRSRGTSTSPGKTLYSMLEVHSSVYGEDGTHVGIGSSPVVSIIHRVADNTYNTQWNGIGDPPDGPYWDGSSDSSTGFGGDNGRGAVALDICFSEVEAARRKNWHLVCSDRAESNRGGIRGSNSAPSAADIAHGIEMPSYIMQWSDDTKDTHYDDDLGSSYGYLSYQQRAGDAGQCASKGDISFQSGGADYGEWLEIGDISEWGFTAEQAMNRIRSLGSDPPLLGLLEGVIVRVRDGKIWKDGPGRAMPITCRSCIIGNASAISVEDGTAGEIVSFIGQLPIFVKGLAKQGDYIIPGPTGYGLAVSSDDITFEQYKSAIGTIWEDKDKEEIFRILCAVGIK